VCARPGTERRPRAEHILHSDTPLALRLSGTLLLGVVRIYSRQLVYLSTDCEETLTKLTQVRPRRTHAPLSSQARHFRPADPR